MMKSSTYRQSTLPSGTLAHGVLFSWVASALMRQKGAQGFLGVYRYAGGIVMSAVCGVTACVACADDDVDGVDHERLTMHVGQSGRD